MKKTLRRCSVLSMNHRCEVTKSYFQMFKTKGYKLIKAYFFECHLYDLKNKTDTHLMLRKSQLDTTSPNILYSQDYMASWTSTIRKTLDFVMQRINLEGFSFIDIGCGKGKVCIEARLTRVVGNSPQKYIGFDFDAKLVKIAKANSYQIFGDEGYFIHSDILDIDFTAISKFLLIYMYNPFDTFIVNQLLKKIIVEKVVIICINPGAKLSFLKQGYTLVHQVRDWHPNLCYDIYERNTKKYI